MGAAFPLRAQFAVRDDLARWDRERHAAVPRVRCNLMDRWQDAIAVLEDRHLIAHSIALEDIEVQGQGVPRSSAPSSRSSFTSCLTRP